MAHGQWLHEEALTFVKPPRLREGDTVAVLSPSWGGPRKFPHVFELGLRNLESLFGLKIKEYPTARMDAALTYANPQLRAEDLNRAFADPEVSAIIASIGGDDSVRILPFLDTELILAHPKILMGYSDTTAINLFLNSKGLVTFNGPSVMAGLANLRHEPPEVTDGIRGTLLDDAREYRPFSVWANNYVEWNTPGYDGETSEWRPNPGWRVLQGKAPAEGRLVGGCIEVFEFLKGTPFWPAPGFFSGTMLFFETSEEKPTPNNVKYMLRNYGSMGILDEVSAILLGRARSYTDGEKAELEQVLVQVVRGEFGRDDIPIIANMDFGHTEPQWVIPLGVQARVDPAAPSFTLLESPVV